MLLAEENEVRHASHGAVIIHDFADDSGRLQSGETCQIDRGFGLAASLEDTSCAGTEWKNVSWSRKVFRTTVRSNSGADRLCTIVSRDSCCYLTTLQIN